MSTVEGKLAVMGGAAKINGMIAFFLCRVPGTFKISRS